MSVNDVELRLKLLLVVSTVLVAFSLSGRGSVGASAPSDLPKINMTQDAEMKVVFLGVSPDYINESRFMSRTTHGVSQFAYPNNMTWNFNVSMAFQDFPVSVMDSLTNNSYQSGGITYYNITLLDTLLSQIDFLGVPSRGYQLVFMQVPNGGVDHSWFYVQERLDLFLGRTDFFDGNPSKYWAFPPNFGGQRRVMYFDLSDIIELNPTKTVVTDNAVRLFNNAQVDIFVNLLGSSDPRMISADTQRYENYTVRILWLNGTDESLQTWQLEKAFEDLMPWTNWTIEVQTKPMGSELNSLIENRTVQLPKPMSYSFSLANGSSFAVEAHRNVLWEVWKDSGEHDALSQLLFSHVSQYFNLTDLNDKSVIPLVILQLRNDTGIGGVAGIGPGISWFPYNVVILGYQGGTISRMGESGPILLAHQLRHEIGHWLSLPHHSSRFDLGYPKVICSMRAVTNRFCAFCKDARARMSFISDYQALTEFLSNSTDLLSQYGNQETLNSIAGELNGSLQLLDNWNYADSVATVKHAYQQAQNAIIDAQNRQFVYTRAIPFAIALIAIVFASTVFIIRFSIRRKLKQAEKGNREN